MNVTHSPFQKACRILGSYAALGAIFDPPVSAQGVAKWSEAGVPGERVLRLASATNFEVTPHELRPDLYPHPDDGLPAYLRRGAVPASDVLDQLREVMTEEEHRGLIAALDQGNEVAFGFVKGLAEKYRVVWTDTVIAACASARSAGREDRA